jgi:hypothetical protein
LGILSSGGNLSILNQFIGVMTVLLEYRANQAAHQLNELFAMIKCLHALEYFGLGRYGGPVDFKRFLKGLENINKILEPEVNFIYPSRLALNA